MMVPGSHVLVTGSSGFVGTHLTANLAASGVLVSGLDRAGGEATFQGDLRSDAFVTDVLMRVQPTHVFHLAGALPGGAEVTAMYEENVLNTVRLLEAIRVSGRPVTVLVASSSAVYGDTQPAENPLTEHRSFHPISDYGASKAGQEMAALQYHLAHGLRTIRVRTFNLIGPGQPPQLMLPALARQVAAGEQAPGPIVVHAGNLDARRDFVDARDAVRALVALAEHGEPGSVYNVCSGRGRSVRECIEVLSHLTDRPVRAECDAALVRRVDIADQVGDATRLQQATGWQPAIPFEDSIRDVLNEWRARVRLEREVRS